MEVVRTVGAVMSAIKLVVDLVDQTTTQGAKLAAGLDCIKEDLDLIKARLVEDHELHRQPLMQVKLQELVYSIDDFVRQLWNPHAVFRFALSVIGNNPTSKVTATMDGLKDRAKTLREELDKRHQWNKSDSSKIPDLRSPSAVPTYAAESELVGIAQAKEQIVELLSPIDGSLRVICIAARSGMGKSALARALYRDEDVVTKFNCKAWVVLSNNNAADIVKKIHQETVQTSAPTVTTTEDSPHFSKNKRYLVFVDDVQHGTALEDIQKAFHENAMDSRIIVTTSVPSIAAQFSSGSFVYSMQGLDKENARELFRRKLRGKAHYSVEDKHRLGNKDVDVVVDKCDGLPMALISAAECLRGKGVLFPKYANFVKVSQELGEYLACSESEFDLFRRRNGDVTTFTEMRRAIVEPYELLLNNGEKECLLYGSIFPSGYQINIKSLVRLLIAEGLGPGDPHMVKDPEFVANDVHDCLIMLMNQQMIEPIHSNCNASKSCRLHGIMLEFSIKKAVSRNLVSFYHNEKLLYNTAGKFRRLTIRSSPDVESPLPKEIDLSSLRSLAIFERGIVNFKECKLLRVLIVEGCCGLTLEDLDNICGLTFLKYLSLRRTNIQKLPQSVKNLLGLETLDTRDTVVIKLPTEALMLPKLAYLFGKFELTTLQNQDTANELTDFFSQKRSQLHTIGEISVHTEEAFKIVLIVIHYAVQLKKVKVCFNEVLPVQGPTEEQPNQSGKRQRLSTMASATSASSRLAETARRLGATARSLYDTLNGRSLRLESVSIDFNEVPNSFLDFLKINGTVSSIKLRRGRGNLPGPVVLGHVSNLKKLHLSSTGLESDKLGALQHLKCLQYLKLAEEGLTLWDSVFHVEVGGFISLIWLCFKASNLNHPPLKIDEGVNTPLHSLLLLCPVPDIEPEGIRVEGISHLAKLNEVTLHNSASDALVGAWKEEAKKHVNRPYVEKQQE